MLRRLVTLALLVPLVFAPAAMAAPGPTPAKSAMTQTDGKKKKKRTAKHKKHRKHHRKTSRKKTGGARN